MNALPNGSAQAATALRQLAARPEIAVDADHLRALADDLASGDPGRTARWADADLHAAFPAQDLIAAPEHRWQRWLDRLGHANTVLLVLPLLVTWIGLRSASAGYAALFEGDPDAAAQPFFALWQAGFGGTTETFGTVVAWMLICLVLLVGGQLAARVLGQRITIEQVTAERATQRDLTRALRLASCALGQTRATPALVATQLRDSADTLTRAADETRKTLAALQRATTKAQKLIDTHLEVLSRTPATLDQATAGLTAASTALDGSSTQIGGAVRDVATQLAGLESGHKELSTILTQALTAHDDAAAARLAVARADARTAHDELVAAIGLALQRTTDELAHDATQSAAQFTAAHAQLAGTITQLTQALQEGHRVQETGAAATQTQISALEEMIDRAQALSDQIADLQAQAA